MKRYIAFAKAASPDDIHYYNKDEGLTFVETARFTAAAEALKLSDESLYKVQSAIIADPNVGDLIPGVDGARKIRVAYLSKQGNKKIGKRSGLRIIYIVFFVDSYTYLLDIYYKDNQADLSSQDKKDINQLIRDAKEARNKKNKEDAR